MARACSLYLRRQLNTHRTVCSPSPSPSSKGTVKCALCCRRLQLAMVAILLVVLFPVLCGVAVGNQYHYPGCRDTVKAVPDLSENCSAILCSHRYRPVCGSDGEEYQNDCILCKAACSDKDLYKSCDGFCPCRLRRPETAPDGDDPSRLVPSLGASIVPAGFCLSDDIEHLIKTDPCMFQCPAKVELVCSNDGMSHMNECYLCKSACNNPDRPLFKVCDGSCPCQGAPHQREMKTAEDCADGKCAKDASDHFAQDVGYETEDPVTKYSNAYNEHESQGYEAASPVDKPGSEADTEGNKDATEGNEVEGGEDAGGEQGKEVEEDDSKDTEKGDEVEAEETEDGGNADKDAGDDGTERGDEVEEEETTEQLGDEVEEEETTEQLGDEVEDEEGEFEENGEFADDDGWGFGDNGGFEEDEEEWDGEGEFVEFETGEAVEFTDGHFKVNTEDD